MCTLACAALARLQISIRFIFILEMRNICILNVRNTHTQYPLSIHARINARVSLRVLCGTQNVEIRISNPPTPFKMISSK